MQEGNHVVVCTESWFLYIAEWCTSVWTYFHLSICSPIEGRSGCFQFFIIVHNVAISIYVQGLV